MMALLLAAGAADEAAGAAGAAAGAACGAACGADAGIGAAIAGAGMATYCGAVVCSCFIVILKSPSSMLSSLMFDLLIVFIRWKRG